VESGASVVECKKSVALLLFGKFKKERTEKVDIGVDGATLPERCFFCKALVLSKRLFLYNHA
jgi:hypothetical protein